MDTHLLLIEDFLSYSRSEPYQLSQFNGLIVSPDSFLSQVMVRDSRGVERRLSRRSPLTISSGTASIWPALPFNKSLGGGNWTQFPVDTLRLLTFLEPSCLDLKIANYVGITDFASVIFDEEGNDTPLVYNDFSIPIQELSYVNVAVEPESALDFFLTPGDWEIIILLDYNEVVNTTFTSQNMNSYRVDARGKNVLRVIVRYNGVPVVPNTHVIVTGG